MLKLPRGLVSSQVFMSSFKIARIARSCGCAIWPLAFLRSRERCLCQSLSVFQSPEQKILTLPHPEDTRVTAQDVRTWLLKRHPEVAAAYVEDTPALAKDAAAAGPVLSSAL